MAEIVKKTKSGNLIFEDVELSGVGQNIPNTRKATTRRLRVVFMKENGAEISFYLHKDEVTFIKNQLARFEQDRLNYRNYKKNRNEKE